MKDVAFQQIEAVTDATSSFGLNLKKSIEMCSKEAAEVARSLSEIVDMEDILKSIHKVSNPDDDFDNRKSKIIHHPIGVSSTTVENAKSSTEEKHEDDMINTTISKATNEKNNKNDGLVDNRTK